MDDGIYYYTWPLSKPSHAVQTSFRHEHIPVFYKLCVLREFLGKCVVAYIDDILIFFSSRSEHITHVRQVLSTLREN